MLFDALVFFYALICLLLLVVVLLQQGKGGDIAAAFGGSSSQTAFGARSGATVLTRATTVLGVLFMVGSIMLGILYRGGGSSVVSGVGGPTAPPPTATKGPALPAGASQQPSLPVQVPQTTPVTTPAPAAGKDAAKPPVKPVKKGGGKGDIK
jgi:preprotein translocase subunit SecG